MSLTWMRLIAVSLNSLLRQTCERDDHLHGSMIGEVKTEASALNEDQNILRVEPETKEEYREKQLHGGSQSSEQPSPWPAAPKAMHRIPRGAQRHQRVSVCPAGLRACGPAGRGLRGVDCGACGSVVLWGL